MARLEISRIAPCLLRCLEVFSLAVQINRKHTTALSVSDQRLTKSDRRIVKTIRWVCAHVLLAAWVASCMLCPSFAQSIPSPSQGLWPFDTATGGQFDTINLAALGIQVHATLFSKQGAASLPFSFVAGASDFVGPNTTGKSGPTTNFGSADLLGMSVTQLSHVVTNGCSVVIDGNPVYGNYTQFTAFYYSDVFGNSHSFPISIQTPCTVSQKAGSPHSASAYDVLGSGYYLVVTMTPIQLSGAVDWSLTYNLYDPAGRCLGCVAGETDADGNSEQEICTNGFYYPCTYTDSLGQQILTVSSITGQASPFTVVWNNPTGQSQATITMPIIYVGGNGTTCPGNTNTTVSEFNVLTNITFADGSPLSVGWEETSGTNPNGGPCYTGRLASLSLPTGGTITYGYSGTNNIDNTPSHMTRTTSDGTWQYVHTYLSGISSTTSVTDPAGNETDYTFTGYENKGYETLRKVYQGSAASGALLKTVQTCYNGKFTSCTTPSTSPSVPFTQTDVFTSFNNSSSNLVETKFDAYENVIEVKKYDFGAAMPPTGNPLSDTLIYYGQSWNGTACTAYPSGVHILSTPCFTYTKNSAGTTVAQTQITYSNTGHPISSAQWTGGSSLLTSTATYNTNGMIATSTDVNNTLSTYHYDGTDGCNNLLPTSVTVTGLNLPSSGLTKSMQWNCSGGVLTQAVDANGQPANYTYNDPLWRITSMTDPTGASTTYKYPNPNTFESVMNFNGTTSTSDRLITKDGLGRQIFAQTRQGQAPATTTFDSVQTSYGWTPTTSTVIGGFFTKTTVPYSGTQAQSAPNGTANTVTQQDALSRVYAVTDGGGRTTTYGYSQNDVLVTVSPAPAGENTKARQNQFDGLGRLTSVCEVTSASGSGAGACGQTNPKTGLLTNYNYDALGNLLAVTQNAQPGAIGGMQTRTYVYDGLSRLTSETNPESGATAYEYDANGTCGNSSGDLVERIDANGNTTCEGYDGLHRVTSTTYIGPNATTNRYFVYDAATVNGQSIANAKGRLAEGYTATCSTCTKGTDEGFGYTARGELSDFYESTPNSAGYYHVPMTYWANGLLETFGPFLTEDQAGYVPDGEGRAGAVYDFRYLSYPVPSISYNAASQPTQIMTSCYQSTCYPITYQYDPKTLRMTYYGAALSAGIISGSLTWNPNASLQQLVIADPFNAADAQTCTYSADDLSRLASVNCGSVWAQNFSYDAFGNLTKSGSIAWTPGYSASTNRYALGGTSYDANGNVLNDTFNQYTWDAEGKPLSTFYSYPGDTFTFVYDAFGHKVESSINGAYSRSYVTIGNFKLTAAGQAPSYSEFPIPGGSILGQLGGATGVQLADWLGTSRAFWSYTGGGWGQSGAHAPFGESYAYNNGYPEDFTGQDNDGMTNTTYYFPERQYRSSQGRWLSPDPAGFSAASPTNPQSWNRYAYVVNNPLSLKDPLGLWCVWEDNTHDADPGSGGFAEDKCESQGGHWDPYDTIAGVLQDGNGNVTQINYIVPGGTLPYNPPGMTLEGLDTSLASYQQLPGGYVPGTSSFSDNTLGLWFDNTSLGRWLNLNASKELAWEGAHPDLMDTVACSLAPDATNDIKDVRAQMNGEKPSPADEGHPEGGQPVWIPNTNSTKNGGGATQKTPWGELTMTPGKEAQGEAQGGAAAPALFFDSVASASQCVTKPN